MPLSHPYAPVTHGAALVLGETVALDAAAADALAFRKVNPKEAFTLCDAAGRFFRASLVTLSHAGASALVYEAMPASPESPVEITLACAVLQRQRMLWVAQKCAELGVAHLQPLFTLKSVQAEGLAHEKAHAWAGQCLKGARQCRRGSVPQAHATVALDAFMRSPAWAAADARVFLDDRADESDGDVLARADLRSITLVIGPEGGFANVERERMLTAGARPLRLGARVLRAETAVMAGLVVVQHRLGDLRP